MRDGFWDVHMQALLCSGLYGVVRSISASPLAHNHQRSLGVTALGGDEDCS